MAALNSDGGERYGRCAATNSPYTVELAKSNHRQGKYCWTITWDEDACTKRRCCGDTPDKFVLRNLGEAGAGHGASRGTWGWARQGPPGSCAEGLPSLPELQTCRDTEYRTAASHPEVVSMLIPAPPCHVGWYHTGTPPPGSGNQTSPSRPTLRAGCALCFRSSRAAPSCAANTGKGQYDKSSTTAAVKLGVKKLGAFTVSASLPEAFPGETVLVVPLPATVRQAAASRRGARLCMTLSGTCDRLHELLGLGDEEDPEAAWEAALLDKDTQW